MENIKELIEKAQAGDYEAKYHLALLYHRGEGVEQNNEKMFEIMKGLAESELEGDEDDYETMSFYIDLARYEMGCIYYYGEVVEQDYQKAVYWLNLSDNENAIKLLADCYYYGQGVEPDLETALKYYREAAVLCHPEAQERFAFLMSEYAGAQNSKESIKWCYFAVKNYYGIGMKYYLEGDDAAEELYNRAVRAFEKYAELESFCLLDKLNYYSEYSLEELNIKLNNYYAWLFTFPLEVK